MKRAVAVQYRQKHTPDPALFKIDQTPKRIAFGDAARIARLRGMAIVFY